MLNAHMHTQIHLTMDTAMDTGSLRIAAYVARKLNLGEQKLARKFQEVECEISTEEIETVGGVHLYHSCAHGLYPPVEASLN